GRPPRPGRVRPTPRCARSRPLPYDDGFAPPGEAAEVVVGGAGALRGDHAGADGRLGCAGGAEDLALPRPQDAFQHLAALARLRVRDPYSWYGEARLGVEGRVRVAHPQRGVGDEAQPAPL